MEAEERKIALVHEWLEKANSDLIVAERALQPPALPDITAFHCQQAVEKTLKGYLTWHDHAFRWTHDLPALLRQCQKIHEGFDLLRQTAEELSPFAASSRYPGYGPALTVDEAGRALQLAHEAHTLIRRRLPPQFQP